MVETSTLFLEHGGKMGALIKAKDWAQTPLGAAACWPQSLKTCVRIVLSSAQPMAVGWGPESLLIYNDAYQSILGDKHVHSLGQPAKVVWGEVWDTIAAKIHLSPSMNGVTCDDPIQLLVEHDGCLNESYYSFDFSPIPDETGTPEGFLCTATDRTLRVVGARQMQTLGGLTKKVFTVTDNAKIYKRALETLRANPNDFPFVVLYEISEDGKRLLLSGQTPEDMPDGVVPAVIDMQTRSEELPELHQALQTGTIQEVRDLERRFGPMPKNDRGDAPHVALLMPILQVNQSHPLAIMAVGLNPYRSLGDGYSEFLSLVADQIASALTHAYAVKREQKWAETRKELEVVETRNKLAIEAAAMGHFEWDMVTDAFVYSPRMAQVFGYPEQAVLTRNNFSERVHHEDLSVRAEAHRQARDTGLLFYEARVVHPDHSVHWLRFNGKIVFDDENQPAKMYGTALDVTQHKLQAQLLEEKVNLRTQALIERNRALKESEERYQRMTEEVQDYAIIVLDKNGTILNWNKGAQKIKGYREAEIVGKNFRLFYRPVDLESKLPEKLIKEAELTGRAMDEGYRVRKDGTYFWGSITITALHDGDNNVIGFSKVTRDLTERKLAEDRMRQYNAELEFQNKELEQFAYVASHDLQEPLRKIQMFAGLLERSVQTGQPTEKYFSKISQTAERMSELIKAVLNYSRLSRNDQQFETVDLQRIFDNVLVDFELLIEEKQVEILSDALPTITAIPLQINQLFSNLIGNAIKFADSAPKIVVTSRTVGANDIPFDTGLADNEYLELVFSDNGIGFEQQYVGKIFTIFQRLNDRVRYSGTGIGLALCKKIVENHAGFITAQSELGSGASFYIYLPLQTKDEPELSLLNS